MKNPILLAIGIADSGNQRAQTFCPECGSPIYSGSPGDNPVGVRASGLWRGSSPPPRAEQASKGRDHHGTPPPQAREGDFRVG